MKNWIDSNTNDKEIIISSRITLARNINTFTFPNKMSCEEGQRLVNIIANNFNLEETGDEFKLIKMWDSNEDILNYYLEKQIISSKLLENKRNAGLIIDKDEARSIMINEEDHMKLQCISSGLNLKEPYEQVNILDNFLEDNLDYSFNEQFGYLTSSLTNLGTAMKVAVIIHLPAITLNKENISLLKSLTQVGITMRGVYGEGIEAKGNIYEISNQVSLGVTEEELINNLEAISYKIMLMENNARKKLLTNSEAEIKDKIFRAFGILKNSYIIGGDESLELLSFLRFGVESNIINNIDKKLLNKLLVNIQPANLQILTGKRLSSKEKDIERARILRESLV